MAEETQAENTATQVETKDLQRETPSSGGGGGSSVGKVIMWVLLLVILVVGGMLAYSAYSTSSVGDEADEVLAHLQAGECSEIFEDTTDTFKQFTDAETWNAECERVSEVLVGDPVQTSVNVDSEADPKTADVRYDVEGTTEIIYIVGMTFVENEDGDWELDSLTSLPKDAVEAAENADETVEEGEATDETTEEDNNEPDTPDEE